ncbi:MAG: DNA mismatch repair protein MutS [Bacteroidales bacterium]|nr:DNA mismatch repair protein MutS [Bacteroidales bacterium]MEE0991902.1 DNA mismatch repair protein MutS [Bacteroidales bacterium]
MAVKKDSETPLMKQYNSLKEQYPDTILLFRVGDFYETFGQDAIATSQILGITLTKRGGGDENELAGFPFHAIDTYLPKFLRSGKRVAICEQLEDPKSVKGLVKRGVTEVVTPSMSYNDKTDDGASNNYLCGIHYGKLFVGIAFVDISTGEFFISRGEKSEADKLFQSLSPRELVIQKKYLREFQKDHKENIYIKTYEDWVFNSDYANEILTEHFSTKSLKGFGVEECKEGIIAAAAALTYMKETLHTQISHISQISTIKSSNYLWLDKFTIRNLELISSPNENGKTLLSILNRTQSNMGLRILQRWIVLPLLDIEQIEHRQNIVKSFIDNDTLSLNTSESLRTIGDLERVISRVAFGRIQPSELLNLKFIIREIGKLKKDFSENGSKFLKTEAEKLNPCFDLEQYLEKYISSDAPNNIAKGGAIAQGVDSELDSLRELAFNSRQVLEQLKNDECEKTGISSLKIGYNNVFGYYLEVTNTHKDKVPQEWIRKQTLANAERYITEELKELENKIITAQDRISQIENRIYNEVLAKTIQYINSLKANAHILASMDCLLSFAQIAIENNYVRPKLTEQTNITIKDGRHPVIEKSLSAGEQYISNDVYLDRDSQQICIITGPNMSGKSAYLRQTALITLMAQIGSWVPAKMAEIGIVDKIFTRVGASDNISSGESTFMVEMNEAACILNNISERSLILLDEIGRGTSTYDGVSIAWAIASYLHDNRCKPKTLFATHYHELIDMENQYARIKNYHVKVKESGKEVIFLRKIDKGGSEQSFGIHVAKLAGMPRKVVEEAEYMLSQLENKATKAQKVAKKADSSSSKGLQLSFIQLDDPVLSEIKDAILEVDIENLTPIESLNKLYEIKKKLEKV